MVVRRHVKDNLDCLTDQDCLLSPSHQNFTCARSPEAQSLEGAYLYMDRNFGRWVKSGKAVGQSFIEKTQGARESVRTH